MCSGHPLPRCSHHVLIERDRAQAVLSEAEEALKELKEPTSKAVALVERKRAVFARHDRAFSVACVREHLKPTDDPEKSRLIAERVAQLKKSRQWTAVRREAYLRTVLAKYLKDPSRGIRQLDGNENARLVVDALGFLAGLPRLEKGRPLTDGELEAVEVAQAGVAEAPDWLPAEVPTVPAKEGKVTKADRVVKPVAASKAASKAARDAAHPAARPVKSLPTLKAPARQPVKPAPLPPLPPRPSIPVPRVTPAPVSPEPEVVEVVPVVPSVPVPMPARKVVSLPPRPVAPGAVKPARPRRLFGRRK